MSLALAESCTGGLISHRLTNVPGSSGYYLGGVTAYANEAKVRFLGLDPQILEREGAVSRVAVLEMARGARRALGADLAISVSGIAGPGGGTPEKPVGLIWIGLSSVEGDWAWEYRFHGNRLENKERAAEAALQCLLKYLEGGLDGSR